MIAPAIHIHNRKHISHSTFRIKTYLETPRQSRSPPETSPPSQPRHSPEANQYGGPEGARMYLLLFYFYFIFVRSSPLPRAAAGTFARSSRYIRARDSRAAAGTLVRSSSSFTCSSRYIRAQQQLFHAQQHVHSCAAAAARSRAAAGTSVRSSSSLFYFKLKELS